MNESPYLSSNNSPLSMIQMDCWISRNRSVRRRNQDILREARRRRRRARVRSLIFWKPAR